MSFESELLDLMPHNITRNAYVSRDKYSKPSYSTASNSYRARVISKQKMVVGRDGKEQLATTIAYVNCTGSIDPEDKITLPDNSTPPILSVESYPDEGGTHHHAIYFGGGGANRGSNA